LLGALGARFVPYDVAPRTDLGDGWASILSDRSPRTRSTLRRKARKLSEEGDRQFVHVTQPDQIGDWLPAAFDLYAARAASVRRGRLWQSDRGRAFLETWMRRLSGEHALDLAFLLVAGEPQAFAFGIADPDAYYLYGLGFDPRSRLARWSPGEQLLVHLLETAALRGMRNFDFLVGDEPYKRAWATERRVVSTALLGPNRVAQEALSWWPRMIALARRGRHRVSG
jgi:CelD/BcsL family acetyltransferase involved in cellulose biosynthesis